MFSCGVRTLFKVVSSSFFSHNGQVPSDAQGSGNPFCIQSMGASCKAMLKRGPSFVRKYFFEGLSGHKKTVGHQAGPEDRLLECLRDCTVRNGLGGVIHADIWLIDPPGPL